MLKKSFFTVIFFIMLQVAFAQPTLTVLSNKTKEPMPYVHISIKNTTTQKSVAAVTSSKGIAENLATAKSIITLTYVGYSTIIDSIMPNQSKTYYLKEDVFLMDQLVVTATRTKKALKDAPVITQVITAEQIAARGFETVQDVLEADIPSIEFQRHGFSNDINMQGVDARNILILIDGERMAGETRGNIDYSRLNTNDVERIEIVKGAASALYGSQAMGAVINIITKSSKDKFYADASVLYSSFNQINYPSLDKDDEFYQFKNNLDKPNLVVNAALGFYTKKLKGKTSFTIKSTDAYQLYDTDNLTKNYLNTDTIIYESIDETPVGIEGSKDYTIGQKLSYNFNDKIKLKANGSYYIHHKYDFTRDKRHDLYDDITYGIAADYKGINKIHLTASFSFDRYNKYDYFEKLHSKEMVYSHTLINPKAISTFNFNPKNTVISGVEYLYESLIGDIFIPDQLSKQQQNSVQAFLQDDINLGVRTNVIAGIRAEYHSAYGFYATPKLSFMQKINAITFRVNYAAGYRSPSLKELYYNWDHLGLFIIKGDENLVPETNNYFSGSAEYTGSSINTSVSFYKNYFKNKIIGQWENDQSVYQYTNSAQTKLTGIDFLLTLKLHHFFTFKTALSYVHEKIEKNAVKLSSISPITANTQLNYQFTKKNYALTANISGKYIGAKEFNVLDEFKYQGQTIEDYYKVYLEGYWIWRLSASQQFYNAVTLVVGVNNFFNYKADMITFNSSISTGSQYFVKVGASIDKLYNQLF